MAWLIFNISSIFVQTWCILTHFEMCKVSRWSNNIPEIFWDAMWELRLGHSWPGPEVWVRAQDSHWATLLHSQPGYYTLHTVSQLARSVLTGTLKSSKYFQDWKVMKEYEANGGVILHTNIYHLEMTHPILCPLSSWACFVFCFSFTKFMIRCFIEMKILPQAKNDQPAGDH